MIGKLILYMFKPDCPLGRPVGPWVGLSLKEQEAKLWP